MGEIVTAPKKRVHVRDVAKLMAELEQQEKPDKQKADELLLNLIEVLAYYLNDCNYHTSNVYYTVELYRRIQDKAAVIAVPAPPLTH